MNKTIKELVADIGKTGSIYIQGLRIAVSVTDVKVSYGKPRWMVTPITGAEQIWVESIELNPEKP